MMGFLILIAAIPITAILADAYIKSRRIQGHPADVQYVTKQLETLRKENEELKQRVLNLEIIISSVDVLQLPPKKPEETYAAKVEKAAQRLLDGESQ